MRLHALIVCGLATCVAACSSGDGTSDGTPPPSGTTDAGGGGGGGGNPALAFDWTVSTIDDMNAGFQPDVQRAPDGRIGLAYFRRSATSGTCDRVAGSPPILRWDVVYGEDAGNGVVTETVTTVELLAPSGLSLAYDASSVAHISFVGGTEAVRVCGASDLMLARRNGAQWAISTLADSGAATPVFMEDRDQCAAGQNYCNVGDVVGEWSSMVVSGGNPIVAFRDIHFAFTQDDWLRSDLELFQNGGVESLDAGWGGGTYAQLRLRNGSPIVVHHNPHPTTYGSGIWALAFDGTWSRHRVVDVETIGYRLGFSVFGDVAAVAYHDEGDQKLVYYESTDLMNWERDVIDQTGNTGFSPSLVFDSMGNPAVSFHHCGRYDPNSADCPPSEDSVRFSIRDGRTWRAFEVDAAATRGGIDGAFTALAFDGDDNPVIVYQATFADPVDSTTVRELRIARGTRR